MLYKKVQKSVKSYKQEKNYRLQEKNIKKAPFLHIF
jgi:hypothetical protein